MVLWFAGLAFVIVVQVFRDAAIDYRLVMVGALLPDLVDGAAAALDAGGPAHSLLFSIVLLLVVMAATGRRRRARRRLLALPIGTFVHLVLDGAWTHTEWFWWPVLGPAGDGGPPSLDRPVAVLVAQEVVGLAALWWCVRRFRLADRSNRVLFLREGRLRRELVHP